MWKSNAVPRSPDVYSTSNPLQTENIVQVILRGAITRSEIINTYMFCKVGKHWNSWTDNVRKDTSTHVCASHVWYWICFCVCAWDWDKQRGGTLPSEKESIGWMQGSNCASLSSRGSWCWVSAGTRVRPLHITHWAFSSQPQRGAIDLWACAKENETSERPKINSCVQMVTFIMQKSRWDSHRHLQKIMKLAWQTVQGIKHDLK